MIDEIKFREAIVEEAYSWIGTPYHNLGDVKGAGVDCAMILIRVYQKTVPHIVPVDFDPRPYSPEWYLHRDEELYLAGMENYSHRINGDAKAGDLAVFKFGRSPSHGAIVVGNGLMIHAYRPAGKVEVVELRSLESRLHSYWSVF